MLALSRSTARVPSADAVKTSIGWEADVADRAAWRAAARDLLKLDAPMEGSGAAMERSAAGAAEGPKERWKGTCGAGSWISMYVLRAEAMLKSIMSKAAWTAAVAAVGSAGAARCGRRAAASAGKPRAERDWG
jgi:hypothetical protein